MNPQDLLTIRGYVQSLPHIPGKDEAVKVVLVTEDGTEYRILHKGAGTGLLGNINANVEVTGKLSSLAPVQGDDDEGPGNLLVVQSFTLTDGFDDPWYDDAIG